MERNWTKVGAETVERAGGREAVEAAIAALEWNEIPPGGKLTVGFMPGEAIKAAIEQLALPRVSRIAISAIERPADSPDEDGFYPGFYGIEASYKNGLCRAYLLDTGTAVDPACSDFFEAEGGEVEKVERAGTMIWVEKDTAAVAGDVG